MYADETWLCHFSTLVLYFLALAGKMTMSDLQKKRKNHQSQGSGPLKKVKLDAQIKTGATPRDTGFKKKKKKMKQKSYQKKDSSDSKNKFETKNTSVTVGSVTKVNTLSQLVSEGSDAKKKQKKLKKNKKVISTKVQKSNSAGEVSGVEKKKLKKKKWEKRKKNKLKGDKTVKVNENKKKEKKNAKKNKVELNIPKGPSDFDSNWKELLKVRCVQILRALYMLNSGLILGLHPANERLRYRVAPSLIGWVQT